MPASAPPPPSPTEDAGSPVIRFGAAVGLAVAAALACALPASIRVAHSLGGADGGVAHAWLALAAAALGPMLPAVIVLHAAREGVRTFVGPGATLRVYGVALWLAWLVIVLSLFGSALRRTTHQHALAGVTFAMAAAALAVVAAIVCARIVAILRGASQGARRTLGAAIALATAVALAWIGLAFVRVVAADPSSAPAASTVLDTLAFVLSAFLASRAATSTFAVRRTLALLGPPIAVAVAALGFSALHDPTLRTAMDERAPAFVPAVSLVQGP